MRSLLTLIAGVVMLAAPPAWTDEASPAQVLVAYHSDTGHTQALAQAVAAGVDAAPEVEPILRTIADVTDADILAADGILVGTPVHWGSLNARVKDFLDRVGSVLDQEVHGEGRTGGAFCTGGAVASGKELARMAILAAFMNMRFVIVGGLELDGFGNLGSEATTGPVDPGLSEAELEAARISGERFARVTLQMKRGRANPAAP